MLHGFHMEWHLPVEEEADWLRLFLFKDEVRNIAKTVMNDIINIT